MLVDTTTSRLPHLHALLVVTQEQINMILYHYHKWRAQTPITCALSEPDVPPAAKNEYRRVPEYLSNGRDHTPPLETEDPSASSSHPIQIHVEDSARHHHCSCKSPKRHLP